MVPGKLPPENYPPPLQKIACEKIAPYENFPKNKHFLTPNT